MQEKTKQDLIQLGQLVKAGGWKAIPMWKVPKNLRPAMEVGLNNGLFTKESRPSGKTYGVQQFQDWLVIPKKGVSPTPAEKAAVDGRARREMLYRMERADFIKIARTLPGAATIMQRIEALPDNDLKALDILKEKVFEYYNLDPATYWKEQQQGKVTPIVAQSKEMTSIIRGKGKGVNTFPLDRGEFRQTVKKLLDKGMITPQTQDYILNKINAVPIGNYDELINLRDKVYTYYSVEDNLT